VYKKIIDFLIANNVGEIVRVIKQDNVSFKQIVHFSDKIKSVRPIYAESKEAAERRLDQCIKRDGIRLELNNMQLQYEINNKVSTGTVVDISVSGCAVESSTIPIAAGDDIIVTLNFGQHATLCSHFQLKARVVRMAGQMFAAQFLDLDEERKDQFNKRLAYEASQIPFIL
jgi:predicted small secreted protein